MKNTTATPEEKTGIEKAREVADKIKSEAEAVKETEEKQIAEIKTNLAKVSEDTDLSQLYNENASIGSENLGGNSPTLSVYSAGKSQSKLADGSKPTEGYFFYKPTQQQFKELTVHILSISRGFYAEPFAKDKTKKPVFNQVISGVIVSDENTLLSEPLPFIMYMTGKKLPPMWEFAKEAGKYTKMKPVSIPLFALNVRLSTFELENDYGMSWIIGFKILKDENDFPIVPTNKEEFLYLRDLVGSGNQLIETIVRAKGIEDDGNEEPIVDDSARSEQYRETKKIFDTPKETISDTDDIPF